MNISPHARWFIVECPCGVAIPLPPQSPLGIFQPPTPRPSLDKWPANFECSHCGQWFSRSAQDIHLEEIASLAHNLSEDSFWQVEFGCDQPRCEKRIDTYTTLPAASSANLVVGFVRASSGMNCPVHGLILQPQEGILVGRSSYLFQ